MHALVLADGDVAERAALDAAWPGWDDGLAYVIAADGGARQAQGLDVTIDRWVGDGDSLGEAGLRALIERGVPVERSGVDKDESDTELAVIAALRAGATRLTILGAIGGERLDHTLANVGLLALDALTGRDARLVDPRARVRLARAPRADGGPAQVVAEGRIGDLVSLLPWGGDVEGVTTAGLRYPLRDEPLAAGPARGLSNVRIATIAEVSFRSGDLLIVESPAPLPSPSDDGPGG